MEEDVRLEDTEETSITQEEFLAAAELFRTAFPSFVGEIERVEAERGKLNDFQLMLAVTRAKEGLVILGWDCRKTVNAIFDTYVGIYKAEGRGAADEWAEFTFGCSRIAVQYPEYVTYMEADEDAEVPIAITLEERIAELTAQIQQQEVELLQNYRELYRLRITANREAGIDMSEDTVNTDELQKS